MVALGGGAVSYERGTPVAYSHTRTPVAGAHLFLTGAHNVLFALKANRSTSLIRDTPLLRPYSRTTHSPTVVLGGVVVSLSEESVRAVSDLGGEHKSFMYRGTSPRRKRPPP